MKKRSKISNDIITLNEVHKLCFAKCFSGMSSFVRLVSQACSHFLQKKLFIKDYLNTITITNGFSVLRKICSHGRLWVFLWFLLCCTQEYDYTVVDSGPPDTEY